MKIKTKFTGSIRFDCKQFTFEMWKKGEEIEWSYIDLKTNAVESGKSNCFKQAIFDCVDRVELFEDYAEDILEGYNKFF